ncbi:MAG: hypothetical protein JNL72_01630 [Flavipsychrobacter sp.]|nr:hypothetical protein [Flavipsychrobacter sp.]
MKTFVLSAIAILLFASCSKRYECRCVPIAPVQEGCSLEFEVKATNTENALDLCRENTCAAARNQCTLK